MGGFLTDGQRKIGRAGAGVGALAVAAKCVSPSRPCSHHQTRITFVLLIPLLLRPIQAFSTLCSYGAFVCSFQTRGECVARDRVHSGAMRVLLSATLSLTV